MNAILLTLPVEPIFIGTSPGGVEWYAYRPEHAPVMRERLACLWARHRRRVALTPTQSFYVADALTVLAENRTVDLTRVVARETYIEAPQEALDVIADRIDMEAASVSDVGVHIDRTHTEAQAEFAVRSRLTSLRMLSRSLRGKRNPR